jgi:glucokinase
MNYYISIDIGATNTRIAKYGNDLLAPLKIVKKPSIKGDLAGFLANLLLEIDEIVTCEDTLQAIVCGVPGRVRNDGYVYELPNLNLRDFNLKTILEDKYHVTTAIINDAILGGLSEAVLGEANKFKRVYFITASSGLGGGLYVDKKFTPSSDEVGHTLFHHLDKDYEIEHLISGGGIPLLCQAHGLTVDSSKAFFAGVEC